MATLATKTMYQLWYLFDAKLASAVLSGIVGDFAHTLAPGKHLSWQDNVNKFGGNSWPVIQGSDRNPRNKSGAGAIDITMNRQDQNKVHNNLIKVYKNRKTDPRAKYIAAFNGWNGSGSPMRYQLYNGETAYTDDSHKWHEHIEVYYAYIDDPQMPRAVISAAMGESVEQYLGTGGTPGNNNQASGDSMDNKERDFFLNGPDPKNWPFPGVDMTHSQGVPRDHFSAEDYRLGKEIEAVEKKAEELAHQNGELRKEVDALRKALAEKPIPVAEPIDYPKLVDALVAKLAASKA